MRRWCFAVAVATLLVAPSVARAQYFGRNKVQYRNFRFDIIRTQHFDVYYYPRERAAALDAARMAERAYARLSRALNHEWRERKPLILYASQSDFQQTNVISAEMGEGLGGVTEFFKHRIAIPFTGAYADFDQVLQHEIVHQFQYDVISRGLVGGGIEALIQIAPPGWWMEGMAEYLSIGPLYPRTAMWLRQAALEGNLPTIEQLTNDQSIFPYRYGHAIWSYICQKWGDEVVGALLQASMTGGIEQGFRRVLGISTEQLSEEWRDAVQTWYLPQIADHQQARRWARPVLTRQRSGGIYHMSPQISPDGSRVAYLSERNFFFIDLYLADTDSGRVLRHLVRSSLNADFESLRFVNSTGSWSNDGQRFAFAAKSGDQDVLAILDVPHDRVIGRYRLGLNAIMNPTWSPDDEHIVFTGSEGGVSDLYMVGSDGQDLRQLTNDRYADLLPSWSPDGRTVAFVTDRGPDTDFRVLRYGNMRVALYHIDSDSTEVLPGMESGTNVNPVWAPDGRSLAFLSDRSGVNNLFLYDFGTRQVYQLTRSYTGISGITDLSPAISWARQADRLVFDYYVGDNHFDVYAIDNPRSLRREPWAPGTADFATLANASALPVRSDLAAGDARADSAARRAADRVASAAAPEPDVPASVSIYRADGGQMRPSDARPAVPDSAGGPLSVQALLDSATLALPDTADFSFHPYRVRFTPDYVSRPTIGYQRDNFGRGMYGGTTIQLSDILGNHELLFSGMVNGRLSEAQVYGAYVNMSRRVNWVVGASQEPYFFYGSSSSEIDSNGVYVWTDRLRRIVFRDAFVQGIYPFNQFKRVELGLRFSNISQSTLNLATHIDYGTGQMWYTDSTSSDGSVAYVQPSLALVQDNSLFGYTSSFYGQRYRFQVAPMIGGWRFTQLQADYRRYFMIGFPFSFSFRALGIGRIGRDAGDFPIYIGTPDLVRGYTYASYTASTSGECSASSTSSLTGCPELDQLIGTRAAVFNAEFRFPMTRSLVLGFLPVGFPPIEAALFFDAGIAWNEGSTLRMHSRSDADLQTVRWPMTSYGVGMRVNLFGFTILRVDYAVPLQRRYSDSARNKHGYLIVSLGPPF